MTDPHRDAAPGQPTAAPTPHPVEVPPAYAVPAPYQPPPAPTYEPTIAYPAAVGYERTVAYASPPVMTAEPTPPTPSLVERVQALPIGLAALIVIPMGVVAKSLPPLSVAMILVALVLAWRFEPAKRMANLMTAVGALLVGMLLTWPQGAEAEVAAPVMPVVTPTVVKSVTSTVTVSPTPTPTVTAAPQYPFNGAAPAVPNPYVPPQHDQQQGDDYDEALGTTSEQYPSYANCEQARSAGRIPLFRGQPGYSPRLDPDGDGVACEGRGKRRV